MPSKSSKLVQAANSRSKSSPHSQTLPVQNLPMTSSPEPAKKKKKKKSKPKTTTVAPEPPLESKDEEDEEEDDDIPPLEPAPGLYRSLTGLPPELEAVHLSATASLSATVAAAARNNPTAAAHAELIAAADDLCRRMDADPQGGISTDDDYWKSLPEHIRNFVSVNWILFVCSNRGNEQHLFSSRPKLCTPLHNRWFNHQGGKVPRKALLDTLLERFLRQICRLINRFFLARHSIHSWSKLSHLIFQHPIALLPLAVSDLSLISLQWHELVL